MSQASFATWPELFVTSHTLCKLKNNDVEETQVCRISGAQLSSGTLTQELGPAHEKLLRFHTSVHETSK